MNAATEPQAGPAPTPSSPPDWQKLDREILCPLCQYNLRGIPDPRCPECGYRFQWAELLDPDLNHPYLFEQTRRHYIRSYFKTLTRNGKPGTFWKTLRPNMRMSGEKLVLYYAICAVLAALPAIWIISFPAIRSVWPWSSAPAAMVTRTRTISGRTYVQRMPPTPNWAQRNLSMLNRNQELTFFICATMAIYPLISIGTLMLFHESMRRAKVLPRHVVRIGLYSADTIVWNGLWIILAMFVQTLPGVPVTLMTLCGLGILLTFVFTTARIAAAYAHYMRFPDPVATAMLSQFIAFLTLAVLWIPQFQQIFRNL